MKRNKTLGTFIILILTALIIQNCDSGKPHKIKLSKNMEIDTNPNANLTTLRIYPNEKRNIAIFRFDNQTGETSLDWLQRGLIDLFSNELSQSPYLNIVNTEELNHLIKKLRKDSKTDNDIHFTAARRFNAEIILSGRYYYQNDSLCIAAELQRVNSGKIIKTETICGGGLEKIFSLVTNLSERIKNDLIRHGGQNDSANRETAEITNSVDAFRCYSKAQNYMDQYIWDKAHYFLLKAVKMDTTFAMAYFKLAKLEFNNQNIKDGKYYLSLAVKYKNNLTRSEKTQLNLYRIMREDGFEAYIKALENAVKQDRYNIRLRISLARQYRNLGFYEKALEHFEIALDYEPDRKSIYNDIAYCYMFIGDYPSALRAIDRYLQLSPNEPNPFDSKGEILLQAGHFKEAKREFRRALKIYPKFINSIGRMAEINIFTANKKSAWEYLKQLSNIKNVNRGLTEYANYQYFYYWRFKEYEKLKALIADDLNRKKLNVEHILLAADFYKSLGDSLQADNIYRKTFSYFKTALDKTDMDSQSLNRFREFALVSGYKPFEARRILLEKPPAEINEQRRMEMNFTLGLLSDRAGRHKEALEYYRRANLNDFHNLLKKIRNISWNKTWKYVFESRKYACKEMPDDLFSADKLLRIAVKNNRRDLEVLAYMMKAQYYKLNNQFDEMEEQFKLAGIPLEKLWLFLGALDNRNLNGFDYKYIDEKSVLSAKDALINNKIYHWHTIDDKQCDGYIDLKTGLSVSDWKTAYAMIKVYSPNEKRVQIRFSSKKSSKIFLNNEQIWQHYNLYSDFIDQDILTVILHRGFNTILLKLVNNTNNWGFYFRITDENGAGLTSINYYPADY